MTKRGHEGTPVSGKSPSTIYPVAPVNLVATNKKAPTIIGFDECNYTPSEFYHYEIQEKINNMLRNAWTVQQAMPSNNVVDALGMFYERARSAYTEIQRTKIVDMDNRCKSIFEVSMVFLAALCVWSATPKGDPHKIRSRVVSNA